MTEEPLTTIRRKEEKEKEEEEEERKLACSGSILHSASYYSLLHLQARPRMDGRSMEERWWWRSFFLSFLFFPSFHVYTFTTILSLLRLPLRNALLSLSSFPISVLSYSTFFVVAPGSIRETPHPAVRGLRRVEIHCMYSVYLYPLSHTECEYYTKGLRYFITFVFPRPDEWASIKARGPSQTAGAREASQAYFLAWIVGLTLSRLRPSLEPRSSQRPNSSRPVSPFL